MNVKTIFRLMVLCLLVPGLNACSSDDDEVLQPWLDVTPANIAGTWKLTEWNNSSVAQGTYCYIVFERRDRTYKMYQKFDSMYPRYITGEYSIEKDDDDNYVISGTYDYGNGLWNNSYIVTELLASGSMKWTVKGNADDVSRYERCNAVPDDILEETKYSY